MTAEREIGERLEPARLRVRIAAAEIPEAALAPEAAEPAGPERFPGQDRALEAIGFGARIPAPGFNIFALGESRAGRREMLRAVMAEEAAALPPGPDWVYVNNFDAPHRPRALELPHGTGVPLREEMARLVEDLALGLPAAFESEDYAARLSAIRAEGQAAHDELIRDLRERANAEGIALLRTPMGFGFAPMRDGEIVDPKSFNAWPEEARKATAERIEAFQGELSRLVERDLPGIEKSVRARIRALDRETVHATIRVEIAEVVERFAGLEAVAGYLAEVERDLVDNVHLFRELAKVGEEIPLARKLEHPALRRYAVNVIAGAEASEDGPERKIVEEPDPTHANLVGRVEYQPMQGALITDFTLIKPGALHRANGGFLILEARALLMQPFAWEALKRCLKTGRIRIAPLADRLGLVSTISLEPDEIPLTVKVALIGDRMLYYLLSALDPDFAKLFKVEADFEEAIDRSEESLAAMARLLARIAAREGLAPLERAAAARLLEEASRLADDAAKFTLDTGALSDLLREAGHWAREAGAAAIGGSHVDRAVEARRRRAGRLRERTVEAITREILDIATEGAEIGQINGLSVLALGETRFGRPARITARTRLGAGKIVDIEREVKLGGPLHSKGVLILSSFLAARYGADEPVSLSASLVFEQSYGGVDGDSASSAELYALLSSLAEVPIRQSLAVTGSVDQAGRVQAIGGVNEKIEGFFEVCAARGLTGEQGVLIPRANIQHLNLRSEVVEAVAGGRFSVHAVSHVDEGIALLTGMAAGAPGPDGAFPEATVNARVAAKLAAYAEAARRYLRPREDEPEEGEA